MSTFREFLNEHILNEAKVQYFKVEKTGPYNWIEDYAKGIKEFIDDVLKTNKDLSKFEKHIEKQQKILLSNINDLLDACDKFEGNESKGSERKVFFDTDEGLQGVIKVVLYKLEELQTYIENSVWDFMDEIEDYSSKRDREQIGFEAKNVIKEIQKYIKLVKEFK